MTEQLTNAGLRLPEYPFPDDDGATGDFHSGAIIARAIQAARELADILSQSAASKVVVSVGAIRWEVELCAHQGVLPDQAPPADPPDKEGQVVTAPLVGAFYRSPGPGLPPFAELGAEVEAGQQVAIIEAMKTMNEVLAPCSGTVTQIHATDSEIVEYEQPLITILPRTGSGT